mgnify:CR=1 FL=1|tara:strand:+ start:12800 stop:13453 length:654 start_codon:yes stop_codon:yes gene_type:complete
MTEINLLDSYPRAKRPISANRSADPNNRIIARRFGREYFDGDRTQGYGGYRYDGRWIAVARRFKDFYQLAPGDRILDVGCAKGFMLHDLLQVVPGVDVYGVDISEYAVEQSMDDVSSRLSVGNAEQLPYPDNSFDLVVSINTIHNLPRDRCLEATREIQRVSRRHKYIQVDSWLTDEHRKNLERWVLTALTCLAPEAWKSLFHEAGYTGDYYWTLAE